MSDPPAVLPEINYCFNIILIDIEALTDNLLSVKFDLKNCVERRRRRGIQFILIHWFNSIAKRCEKGWRRAIGGARVRNYNHGVTTENHVRTLMSRSWSRAC